MPAPAAFEFVHGVIERLDLAGNLVGLAGAVLLLFVDGGLQVFQRSIYPVHDVGVLFYEVRHHAHAFVERLRHLGHLLLQLIDLRLQLDEFLAGAKSRSQRKADGENQGENSGGAIGFHSQPIGCQNSRR